MHTATNSKFTTAWLPILKLTQERIDAEGQELGGQKHHLGFSTGHLDSLNCIKELLNLVSNCRLSCALKKTCHASCTSERVVLQLAHHTSLRHQFMASVMGTSQAFQWYQKRTKEAAYSGTPLDGKRDVCMTWRCWAGLPCTNHRPLAWNISNLHDTHYPFDCSYSSLLWCWGDFTATAHGKGIYGCTGA